MIDFLTIANNCSSLRTLSSMTITPVLVEPLRLQYSLKTAFSSSGILTSNLVDIVADVWHLLYNSNMLLGFKTQVNLNNEQRTVFAKHAGTARHAYNQGLALTQHLLDWNGANPSNKIKFPSAIDLHKWYVASVKPEFPWIYEVSKCAGQYALKALRDGWDRCFKKLSSPPRFKRKGQHDSFMLDGTIKILGSNHIQVPVIGVLKTFETLPQVKPKNVTISRQSDKWFISFKLEIETIQTEKTNLSVGVDLGVKQFATLSNGQVFDAPPEYKYLKAQIAKLQYLNRNKQRGSQGYKDFLHRVAQLHYRLTCIRKDFLNKLTTYLAKSFQYVCIEDLNVSGMLKFGSLSGAVAMLGFYEFRKQLEYKCKLYGSELRIIGRWEPSSKLHHLCGWKNEALTLKDRVFHCPECAESIDRDLNAALNIERIGLSLSS